MNLTKEHSIWHYSVHLGLAILLVIFLVFSDLAFAKPYEIGSNLVFGEPQSLVQGHVLKDLSFEQSVVRSKNGFFNGDDFHIGKSSSLSLEFSDFTVLRSDELTTFSVENSQTPEITLENGKIWISTKELATVYLPQAKVESLHGSVLIEKGDKDITFVTAWSNPAKVTFFSQENEKIWEFILPAQHQIKFAPQLYFSKKDFDSFRFSKLQKEFEVQKVESSVFIAQNLEQDKKWIGGILRKISERKSRFFNIDIKASIFELSPNTKSRKEKNSLREEVMTVWDVLDSKRFPLLEQKISDLSEKHQQKFLQYISFFEPSEKSIVLTTKSFPKEVSSLWKNLWTLESLISLNSEENIEIDTVSTIVKQLDSLSSKEKESLEFTVLSFFKNYENLDISVIELLSQVEKSLISGETDAELKATRQLEIAQTIFSITEDMTKKKNFRMARKLLDKIDMDSIMEGQSVSTLASAQNKLKDEQWFRRGEVEYAEILGSEEKEEFEQYLVLKNRLLELNEKQVHSAPTEDVFLASTEAIELLKTKNIIAEQASLIEGETHKFQLTNAKTKEGVIFSSIYDAQNQVFSNLTLYDSENRAIEDMKKYSFSLTEINAITPDSIKKLIAQPKVEVPSSQTEVAKKRLPSEIIDFVFSISQGDFVENDILVSAQNMEVLSLQDVVVSSASPHYLAIQAYEESEKRLTRTSSRGRTSSYSDSAYTNTLPKYLKYEVSFTYNVETKLASGVSAQYLIGKKSELVVLDETYSLQDMIEILDEKFEYIQDISDTFGTVSGQMNLAGVTLKTENIDVESPSRVKISLASHGITKVEFSGIYNPKTQSFSTISILNIANNPVVLSDRTTLSDFISQLLSKSKDLQLKVDTWKKNNTDNL